MLLPHLIAPLQVGVLELQNRIFMAPLTRCRVDQDYVPTPLMAEYYSQRVGAGLIISESTSVAQHCSTFGTEPGIYNDDQING